MKISKLLLPVVCGGAAVCAPVILAQELPTAEEPVSCLSLNRIKSVDILDQTHLVFHMINGEHYLNVLDNRCSGLRKHSALMYRTSINKLCDLDIITPLDNLGFGFQPSGSCGLGKFLPVQDDEIEALKTRVRQGQ
jgi:hypothetical protein